MPSAQVFQTIVSIILVFRLILVTGEAEYCNIKCVGGHKHTACNAGGQCARPCTPFPDNVYERMSDVAREVFLDVHNKRREHVASGKEKAAGLLNASVSNMQILSWNYEAEYLASCVASRCLDKQDDCRNLLDGTNCGQNIAWISERPGVRTSVKDPKFFAGGMRSWYREIKNCNEGCNFESFKFDEKAETLHFTQVIWAQTKELGCAYMVYGDAEDTKSQMILVCNYCPAGNVNGASVFKTGALGADCGHDQRYPHLCGTQVPLKKSESESESGAFSLTNNINRCTLVTIIIVLLYSINYT